MQSSTVFGDVGFYSLVKALVLEEFSQEWTREVVDNVTSNLSSFRQQRIWNLSIAKPSLTQNCLFVEQKILVLAKTGYLSKTSMSKRPLLVSQWLVMRIARKILGRSSKRKLGFMLKVRPSTWELLLGQRRKQTSQYLRLRAKYESIFLYAYSHIGSGYNILCSLFCHF